MIRDPLQGLEPVGKGHAAAGFRAVLAPSGVAAIEDAVVVDPAVAAAGFGAAFLAVFRFAFFLPAFLAGFFSDFLFAFRPAALFFFFFFAAFFAFLFLAIVTSVESYETEAPRPSTGQGLFNRPGSPWRIEFLGRPAGQQVLVQDVGIELNSSVPHDRRRLRIHRGATKLVDIAPDAERPEIDKIPQEHAAFQPVLEPQPEPVVPGSLALGHAMHVVTVWVGRGLTPS